MQFASTVQFSKYFCSITYLYFYVLFALKGLFPPQLGRASWSWFDFRFSLFVFRFSLFVFRYSNWVGKSNFDIQNPILTFALSRKILFSYSKSSSDVRIESENPTLIFKILFWHSNWVGKSYFDIQNPFLHSHWVGKSFFHIQNPILTFELSRKILFWHSKSYFDIRNQLENRILTFKLLS